jgi:hypothetical protein
MDFYTLFPGLEPVIQNLRGLWPASMIKQSPWMFSVIEASHLLSLAAIGGCILLLNLRLVGVGLTSETPASIEKTVRPILWTALAAIVLTGVTMGMVLAEKMFTSTAYLLKMVSLLAALVFTFGVSIPAAKGDGALSLPARIAAGVAIILWLFAVYVLGTTQGMNPGSFHIVFAAFLIALVAASKRMRIVLAAIAIVAVIAFGIVTYVIFNPLDNYELVMAIDIWTVRVAALVLAGVLAWEALRPAQSDGPLPAPARLAGVFGILLWVTVAAAGRWIGLG